MPIVLLKVTGCDNVTCIVRNEPFLMDNLDCKRPSTRFNISPANNEEQFHHLQYHPLLGTSVESATCQDIGSSNAPTDRSYLPLITCVAFAVSLVIGIILSELSINLSSRINHCPFKKPMDPMDPFAGTLEATRNLF
jgi:hypothetical protein